MGTTKLFVEQRFYSVLQELQQRKIASNINELNVYGKKLIYNYTNNGYESLNEKLREGKQDVYEDHLNKALDKLPNFQEIVYRGIKLTSKQIAKYQNAERNDLHVTERAFTSSTSSIATAHLYGNTIFSIISKTGKKIEDISYYGINSSQNEKEVLFRSNTKFKVLEVKKKGNF